MRAITAALLTALLLPGSAAAEAGVSAGSTLSRPIGARAIGMAQAFTAVSGGVTSIGYNPAGLAELERPEIETAYTNGIVDDSFGFFGYAHPTSLGVISAGLVYYDAGVININLTGGVSEDRRAQQDLVFMGGLSLPLVNGFSAGGILKVYRFLLAEEVEAKGFAVDVGGQWQSPIKGLRAGAALQNLGPPVKFEQEGDPLPSTLRVGAAYTRAIQTTQWMRENAFGFTSLTFTADAIQPRNDEFAFAAGTEVGVAMSEQTEFALRFGYLFNRELDSLSIGLGFRQHRFVLDYALGVMRSIKNIHHVSLGYRF